MIGSAQKTHYFDFGEFRLDTTNQELLRDGTHIPLTQKCFEVLRYLIQNRGRMLKKDEILKVVWAENFVEEANLAQHIYMVRKALRNNGSTVTYIETIPKFGYRFVGDVNETYVDIPAAVNGGPEAGLEGVRENGNRSAVPDRADLDSAKETGDPELLRPGVWKRMTFPVLAALFAAILALFMIAGSVPYFRPLSGTADTGRIRSISILPFEQIGNKKEAELGLGLADTLISRFGNQDKISVSPTASISKFSAETDDPVEIGKRLAVDAVLTGTIQRDDGKVRVNVQLIDVRKGVPVWAEKFDSEFSGVFSFQDEISRQLLRKLGQQLGNLPRITLDNRYTKNIEAYEAYAKGLSLWNKRSEENLPKAIEHFEKAISLDSKFASAYALAADAYSLIGYNRIKFVPANEAISKARTLAGKALELDPGSSEAITAMATVALFEHDPEKAVILYRKAIDLDPNNATAHQRLAWMLTTKENLDAAIREMRLAQKADPRSRIININLARLLRLNRQTDEALEFCKKAIEIDGSQTWSRLILAEIYEQKGLFDKSIAALKAVPVNAPEKKTAKLLLSRVYAKKGNKTEARKILSDLEAKKDSQDSSYEIATIYAVLGEKAEAVKELQRAGGDSLIHYLHIKYDYNLDSIRNTPEYPRILNRSKNNLRKAGDGNS